MIIAREIIFDRIGEGLQEKLESTFKWSSCKEYFNADGSLVSKNTNLKWPSRLGTLRLVKRKIVMTLWNMMTEEKFNVREKTRLEVANEIAAIFISRKFIETRFKWKIEITESGEITESINPTTSNVTDNEDNDDFMEVDDSDDDQEFGDDRRYGHESDDSGDEEIWDDFYNPEHDHEMESDDEYGHHTKKKNRQKAERRSSKIPEWTPPPSDPTAIVQPELLKHMTNITKDESKMDLQSLLNIIPSSYRRM